MLATTLVENGKRATGARLDAAIANIVLTQKPKYVGETKLFGKDYFVAYQPIAGSDGKPVVCTYRFRSAFIAMAAA